MVKAKPPVKKPPLRKLPKAKPLPKSKPEPDDFTIADEEPEYKVETYWVDTGWACGAMDVCGGIVVAGAPIFRRFRGQSFDAVSRRYKVIPCTEEHARSARGPS